jgi:hypothetical protein
MTRLIAEHGVRAVRVGEAMVAYVLAKISLKISEADWGLSLYRRS